MEVSKLFFFFFLGVCGIFTIKWIPSSVSIQQRDSKVHVENEWEIYPPLVKITKRVSKLWDGHLFGVERL